jgi:hypothetical protein
MHTSDVGVQDDPWSHVDSGGCLLYTEKKRIKFIAYLRRHKANTEDDREIPTGTDNGDRYFAMVTDMPRTFTVMIGVISKTKSYPPKQKEDD